MGVDQTRYDDAVGEVDSWLVWILGAEVCRFSYACYDPTLDQDSTIRDNIAILIERDDGTMDVKHL